MNICCFSRVNYWHGISGGMDLHGRLLAEGMVRHGHTVSVISTRHPSDRIREEHNGVQIFYLPDTVFGSRRHGWGAASVAQFAELHIQHPFDVVWSQSFDAFGMAPPAGDVSHVPVVAILHGCMPQEYKSFAANLVNRSPAENIRALAGLLLTYLIIQRRTISRADRVIAVSRAVSASFEKYYGKAFHEKCLVVDNGVDTSLFRPDENLRAETRNGYSVNDDETVIMAIGRITREKGFQVALEALRDLVDHRLKVKLMIVGSGGYLSKLMNMTEQFGLKPHVIFTGHVEHADTARYYNGADIVLNPSLTAEGSPLALLEAMSCCKPVIGSTVGGINSIVVDGENGFLFKPGNAKAISDQVQTIVNNLDLAQTISMSARRTILRKYTVDQMIDHTIAVMEATVSRG